MKVIQFDSNLDVDIRTEICYLLATNKPFFVYEMQKGFKQKRVDVPTELLTRTKKIDSRYFIVVKEDVGELVATKDIKWDEIKYDFPFEEARYNLKFMDMLERYNVYSSTTIYDIPDGERYNIFSYYDSSEYIILEKDTEWMTAVPNKE